jgi:hypothetical protein
VLLHLTSHTKKLGDRHARSIVKGPNYNKKAPDPIFIMQHETLTIRRLS